jgi:hypothetical protein
MTVWLMALGQKQRLGPEEFFTHALSAGVGSKIREGASLAVLPFVGLTQASPRYGLMVGMSSDMMRRWQGSRSRERFSVA